uniref:NADH-ubiquinone oxidoreductase chain 3 n=1 Tax=Loxocorone allax TaxID=393181 RepID=B1B1W0_LOXAA|nr:NADH dehydrogenase subunit 3 [Loxocorone allax]BAG12584.1 NADH dehydrogenase subunit 3 [Loxocorone allax]
MMSFYLSLVCLLISFFFFLVFFMVSNRFMMDREKSSPFECGFDPENSARIPFSMRFFLLAVIFLVFDLEIVLLIPFVLYVGVSKSFGCLFTGFCFCMILFIGVLYEWWEGSFNWIY